MAFLTFAWNGREEINLPLHSGFIRCAICLIMQHAILYRCCNENVHATSQMKCRLFGRVTSRFFVLVIVVGGYLMLIAICYTSTFIYLIPFQRHSIHQTIEAKKHTHTHTGTKTKTEMAKESGNKKMMRKMK